jgi:hypothetical protein
MTRKRIVLPSHGKALVGYLTVNFDFIWKIKITSQSEILSTHASHFRHVDRNWYSAPTPHRHVMLLLLNQANGSSYYLMMSPVVMKVTSYVTRDHTWHWFSQMCLHKPFMFIISFKQNNSGMKDKFRTKFLKVLVSNWVTYKNNTSRITAFVIITLDPDSGVLTIQSLSMNINFSSHKSIRSWLN